MATITPIVFQSEDVPMSNHVGSKRIKKFFIVGTACAVGDTFSLSTYIPTAGTVEVCQVFTPTGNPLLNGISVNYAGATGSVTVGSALTGVVITGIVSLTG